MVIIIIINGCHGNSLIRDHALGYYTQAGNIEGVAMAYFKLENFEELEKLSDTLPENHPLLHVSI